MVSKRTARLVLLTALCLNVVAALQPAAAQKPAAGRTPMKPSLAKAKLTEASAAAKGWKPDAVLIQIAGRNVGQDGMSIFWDYGFYSRTAKTCAVVNVVPGARVRESGGPICESPELKEFMDSDRAATVARSNGITRPAATMVVSVSPVKQESRAVWSVFDDRGMKTGDVMIDIDAQTGAVLSKTTQR